MAKKVKKFLDFLPLYKPLRRKTVKCDGQTDGPTDIVAHRVACTRLKNRKGLENSTVLGSIWKNHRSHNTVVLSRYHSRT